MMQWTPLAQAKNDGAHFDLTLAANRWEERGGEEEEDEEKTNGLLSVRDWKRTPLIFKLYIMFYERISLCYNAQEERGTHQ